jgi:hypothetical protein
LSPTPNLRQRLLPFLLPLFMALTVAVYWSGLYGGYTFDDYPNIVDNGALRPAHVDLKSLIAAALSSPSSQFHRPLSSLTFTANWLLTGTDPFWFKLTNVLIHLGNGLLLYLLTRRLLRVGKPGLGADAERWYAALIAGGWLLLPINLTAVVYVVQRMESLGNLFVLAALLAYVRGRMRMQQDGRGFWGAFIGLGLWTFIGITAKEDAAMAPFYALLIEWMLFKGRSFPDHRRDTRVYALFGIELVLPGVIGLGWLLPGIMNPLTWATRDFTLGQRLLSEARIVMDYLRWIVLPTPHALSFYHDDIHISTGLLQPWTTLAALVGIAALIALALWQRRRAPLLALGIVLFLGAQLMTGTVIPLELVYEQRNYFASFGVLLAIVPLLAAPRAALPLARGTLLGVLFVWWTVLTAQTAWAWGSPLRLAQQLALRAPDSPRAQYELGRTYIILSGYDPDSPFTPLAYPPLERAMNLPDSSILPEQALIFFNARLHRPIRQEWWNRMIARLKDRTPGVQEESSLQALTTCARQGLCDLPHHEMVAAFQAALAHHRQSARITEVYGDYTLNVLRDTPAALALFKRAVEIDPGEPIYRVTLVRLLAVTGHVQQARAEFAKIGADQRLMLGPATVHQMESCLAAGQNGTGCAN